MCGRFVSASPPDRIAAYFGAEVAVAEPLGPNFNVAPTNDVYAVVSHVDDGAAHRHLEAFEWGLLPAWAKDRKSGYKMINARAETIATKPAFKGVFRKHRCIVPMDGFYEWRGEKGARTPFYIHRADGEPLAVAGLWSAWRPPGSAREAPWVHTASVVTTEANQLVSALHDRMPVILPKAMWDTWLDPTNDRIEILAALLVPAPEELLEMHAVSTEVNNVRNKGAHLIEPV